MERKQRKMELLYSEGCPNYEPAKKALREALEQEGIGAEVSLVPVNSDDESRRLVFPGSPTIRENGRDLFPVSEREDWALTCRVYETTEGPKGYPTVEMLRSALNLGREDGAED